MQLDSLGESVNDEPWAQWKWGRGHRRHDAGSPRPWLVNMNAIVTDIVRGTGG